MKERLGGGGVVKTLAESPVIMELIRTIGPIFFGNKNQPPAPLQNRGPELISIEVDGQLIEMTRPGYNIYKQ